MARKRAPWIRYRFTTSASDCRPVKFPPPGPWWRSGYSSDDHAVIITFLSSDAHLRDYWPEAENVEAEGCDAITYTDRFPKPAWYQGLDGQ
jgi:hypothetical protein